MESAEALKYIAFTLLAGATGGVVFDFFRGKRKVIRTGIIITGIEDIIICLLAACEIIVLGRYFDNGIFRPGIILIYLCGFILYLLLLSIVFKLFFYYIFKILFFPMFLFARIIKHIWKLTDKGEEKCRAKEP